MYVPKRWIAPMVLSMILLMAILVMIFSDMRLEQPRSAPPEKVELTAASAPMQDPTNPSCIPSAEQQAFNQFLMTLPPPGTGGPVAGAHSEAVGNNSPNSQFSAGSWGDIGQQWRDVRVGGNVINNHVSNEGNNNTNNLVNGNNNVVGSPNVNINITSPPTTAAPTLVKADAPVTTTAPATTTPPATSPPTTVLAPVTTIAP